MIISVTERGTWKRCPRLAVLSSKNGRHLTTLSSPLALEAGTIVHRAHQLWMLKPDLPVKLHAMTAAHESQARVKDAYRTRVGTEPSADEMLVTYEAIDVSLKMCDNYATRYQTPIPDGYTLYAPEQKIQVPIPGTDHTLEGKLDGLLLDKNGDPVILEKKTYDRRKPEQWFGGNDQMTAYIWLVMQLGLFDGIPYVLYDGMWRRDTPPRGREFNDLFVRRIVTRNLAQVQEFGRFLPIEATKMAETYASPDNAYTNRDWMGCTDCRLEALCTSISRGEDYETLIKTRYQERTDDTDDD